MKTFDIQHVTDKPVRIPDDELKMDRLLEYLQVPEPDLSAASDWNFDLSDYDSAEDLLEDFKESSGYEQWRNRFSPQNDWLYPCDVRGKFQQSVAQKLYEHGLNVVFLSADDDSDRPAGFVLNGGGMDLSADLAKAYVLAGFVPPYDLLLEALKEKSDDDLSADLVLAAGHAARYMQIITERLQEYVDMEPSSSPAP